MTRLKPQERFAAPGRSARARLGTPLGVVTIEAMDAGVIAIDFIDDDGDCGIRASLGRDSSEGDSSCALGIAQRAADELGAYLRDARSRFTIPLGARGTSFQRRVWEAMGTIPCGETVSYGELARRVGSPQASRAVGMACGRNPIPIIVPCHRVVAADGSLHGFSAGLWRKEWLLEHERGAGLFCRGVRSSP